MLGRALFGLFIALTVAYFVWQCLTLAFGVELQGAL